MTHVVFGGSGFIGTHLVRRLAQSGERVLVADLVPPTVPNVDFVRCDVRERIDIRLDAAPSHVYNLAAVHRTPGHAPQEYYDTNVRGATAVTEWASSVDATRLLFTSSIAAYGAREELCTETTALRPIGEYGHSKALAEDVHRAWAAADSNRTLEVCRPAVIFGQGEGGNFSRLGAALAAGRFRYPGRRDTLKACGYVHDLVDSFVFGLADAKPGSTTYNFAFPSLYTIEEICDAFCCVGGYATPSEVHPVLVKVGVAVLLRSPFADLGSRVQKVRLSTAVEPTVLQARGFSWHHDLREALQDWYKAEPAGLWV